MIWWYEGDYSAVYRVGGQEMDQRCDVKRRMKDIAVSGKTVREEWRSSVLRYTKDEAIEPTAEDVNSGSCSDDSNQRRMHHGRRVIGHIDATKGCKRCRYVAWCMGGCSSLAHSARTRCLKSFISIEPKACAFFLGNI